MPPEALKQARLDRGWSQRRLGDEAHVCQADVSHVERGAILPTARRKIIAALGLTEGAT